MTERAAVGSAPARALSSPSRRLAVALAVLAIVAGGPAAQRRLAVANPPAAAAAVAAASLAPSAVPPGPGAEAPVPAALTDQALGLREGPVAVPLALQLPSLGVDASVAGVGITAADVMDAPMGAADDPVWQQAFWYRGSAVPGEPSTALIAGHVNGPGGRPAVFATIGDLKPGDPIVVRDTRTGLDVRFAVTGSETYSLAEAATPAVLIKMYGAGPVGGTGPVASTDGLAHLTLVTCAGVFKGGTHDQRLAVYATRVA